MDKFRYYRFICLLLLGGVLFFGYEGMAEKYKTEMQEAWEETVDNAETSLSGNGLWTRVRWAPTAAGCTCRA